jgi:hypothetical protein
VKSHRRRIGYDGYGQKLRSNCLMRKRLKIYLRTLRLLIGLDGFVKLKSLVRRDPQRVKFLIGCLRSRKKPVSRVNQRKPRNQTGWDESGTK